MSEPRQRHVFVRIPFHPAEFPGLLLDWRQRENVWEALVTYWHEDNARAITGWYPQTQIRPAGREAAPPAREGERGQVRQE